MWGCWVERPCAAAFHGKSRSTDYCEFASHSTPSSGSNNGDTPPAYMLCARGTQQLYLLCLRGRIIRVILMIMLFSYAPLAGKVLNMYAVLPTCGLWVHKRVVDVPDSHTVSKVIVLFV